MDYPYLDIERGDILKMIPPDGRVIGSIGCGYAGTEAKLVAGGREVHGVDISPGAIEVARGRITSARVISPGEQPFEAGSLDGLILADVIEHIPQAWEVLKGFAACVREGGWLVISVPNMRNLTVLKTVFRGGDWPEERLGIFDSTHVQFMTHKRLLRWCDAAGLRLERWFDHEIGFSGPRREKIARIFRRLTLDRFHDWYQQEIQGVFRRGAK